MFDLVAILTVPKDKRVYCQHEGCNKTIYKEIHVLKSVEGFTIVGSTCFSKHFAGCTINRSLIGGCGSDVHNLTDNERDLLLSNTASLLKSLSYSSEYDEHVLSHCITVTLKRFERDNLDPNHPFNESHFRAQYLMLYHGIMRNPRLLNKVRSTCSDQRER